MSGVGKVLSVDYAPTKQGENAWRVITDAQNIGADGLNRNAFWIPKPGPAPALGEQVAWSAHHATWGGITVRKIDWEFAPNDPALYTG